MRKRALLAGLFAICAVTGRTQEIGLRLAGGTSWRTFNGSGYYKSKTGPDRNFAVGVYCDQPVWKRFGIAAGINYLIMRDIPREWSSLEEDYRYNMDVLEIPVYLSLRLSPRRRKGGETRLLAGYSYGKVIGRDEWASGMYLGQSQRNSAPERYGYHLLTAGFERGYQFRNGQTVSLGFQQRFGWRFVRPDKPEHVWDFCLVLKAGFRYRAR